MSFVEEYKDHPKVHVHYIDAEAEGQKCAQVSGDKLESLQSFATTNK